MLSAYPCRSSANKGESSLKTVITDNTLAHLKYDGEHISGDTLRIYAKSIFTCGADYLEINTDTAIKMALEDFSERYILRIENSYDFGYCMGIRFAYVTVPLRLAARIERLPEDQQVILEINADEYSAHALLTYVRRFTFIRRVSVIRLTGLLDSSGENIENLLKWCRQNLSIPIDICPLNTMLTGVNDAVSAYLSGAAMITLSFGRGHYYTSLEQYIINLHINRRTFIHDDVIKAICVASFMFAEIFSAIPTGLANIIDIDNEISGTVYEIESGIIYRPYRARKIPRSPKGETAVDRKIKSIGLEHDIESAIIDMLKKVNFSFYKEITKRNLID